MHWYVEGEHMAAFTIMTNHLLPTPIYTVYERSCEASYHKLYYSHRAWQRYPLCAMWIFFYHKLILNSCSLSYQRTTVTMTVTSWQTCLSIDTWSNGLLGILELYCKRKQKFWNYISAPVLYNCSTMLKPGSWH